MSKAGMFVFYVLVCHCLIVISSNPMKQGLFSRLFQSDYIQNVRNILPFSKPRPNTNNAKPVVDKYDDNEGSIAGYNPEFRAITPLPQNTREKEQNNMNGASIDFSRSEELQEKLIKNTFKDSTHNKAYFNNNNEQIVGATEHSHSVDSDSGNSECLQSKDPKCEEQRKIIEFIFKNRDEENDIDKETTTFNYDMTTDGLDNRIAPNPQVLAALLG